MRIRARESGGSEDMDPRVGPEGDIAGGHEGDAVVGSKAAAAVEPEVTRWSGAWPRWSEEMDPRVGPEGDTAGQPEGDIAGANG